MHDVIITAISAGSWVYAVRPVAKHAHLWMKLRILLIIFLHAAMTEYGRFTTRVPPARALIAKFLADTKRTRS